MEYCLTQKGRTALHWAARCPEPEKRETLEELLISKGADKHAKDNVTEIMEYKSEYQSKYFFQDGNEPQFYLSHDFSATKKQTKGPEAKKVSLSSLVEVQESKKPSPPEEETVS